MLFPVWLSHVSRTCTALFKHGVGVEPPFWPDFWDRGRACARGGGTYPPPSLQRQAQGFHTGVRCPAHNRRWRVDAVAASALQSQARARKQADTQKPSRCCGLIPRGVLCFPAAGAASAAPPGPDPNLGASVLEFWGGVPAPGPYVGARCWASQWAFPAGVACTVRRSGRCCGAPAAAASPPPRTSAPAPLQRACGPAWGSVPEYGLRRAVGAAVHGRGRASGLRVAVQLLSTISGNEGGGQGAGGAAGCAAGGDGAVEVWRGDGGG